MCIRDSYLCGILLLWSFYYRVYFYIHTLRLYEPPSLYFWPFDTMVEFFEYFLFHSCSTAFVSFGSTSVYLSMYVYVCLCICLSVYVYFHPYYQPLSLSIRLPVFYLCVSAYLSVCCLCICLPICMPDCIYLSIFLPICMRIWVYDCLC